MKIKLLTVEEYLQTLPIPFKILVERLRMIILTYFPTIKETVKHEGLWYESKFYLAKIQDHINLSVGITGLTPEEVKWFLGTGKTMRNLKFYPEREIDEPNLVKLLKFIWQKAISEEFIQCHLEK